MRCDDQEQRRYDCGQHVGVTTFNVIAASVQQKVIVLWMSVAAMPFVDSADTERSRWRRSVGIVENNIDDDDDAFVIGV